MKTLPAFHFAVLVCLAVPASFATENTIPVQTPAAQSSLAGSYKGTWGNGTDGGQLRLKLAQDGPNWTAVCTFTFDDAEIPTRTKSVNVSGQKLELVVQWEMQGSPGESRIAGELNGAKLDGIYETKTGTETSSGTWSTTRE
ncbi:MAG: hypothetical protein ABIZ04_21875 [Opitutus sp.]